MLAVGSFFILAAALFKDQLIEFLGSDALGTLWVVCMSAEFFVMQVSALMLYIKIKLHGSIMDRVPTTRRASEVDPPMRYRSNFWSLIERQEEGIRCRITNSSDRGDVGAICCPTTQSNSESAFCPDVELSRTKRYRNSIKTYDCLISSNWTDGWLMPVWTSSMNPFMQPSILYCKLGRKALQESEKEGA